MSSRRALALIAAVTIGITSTAARGAAQDDRAAAREIVKRWQAAIVNVRVVLKMRVSVGGREMQSMDESVETVGTVIDPAGLTVLSLGALNPGAMMNRLMGVVGSGQERMEFGSEPTDVKLRLPDGRELTARIVLRDEDLDLAFLRPTSSPTSRWLRSTSRTRVVPRCSIPSSSCRGSAASAAGRRRHRCRRLARSSKSRAGSTSSRPAARRRGHAGVHAIRQGRRSVDDAIGAGGEARDVFDDGRDGGAGPAPRHSSGG